MVKKTKIILILILMIFLFTVSFFVNAEGPAFLVIQDSPVWEQGNSFPKTRNIIDILIKETTVTGVIAPRLASVDNNNTYLTVINTEYGIEHQIKSCALKPVNTESYLSEKLIFNYDDPNRKLWVISYYLDIFSKQHREQFLKYEKKHLQYSKYWNERQDYGAEDWWDEIGIHESLKFFNSAISIGRLFNDDFWILNIKKVDSGYIITVQGDSNYAKNQEKNDRYDNMLLPLYKDRKTFDIIFIQDGDYMDVYIDTMDNKFATYALVEKSFLEEFKKLIWDENPDKSKVTTWPKRADGSMDYPPPK